MVYGTWRIVSTVLAGDSAEYAVDDWKDMYNMFNGVVIRDVKINNPFAFTSVNLRVRNPADTFEYSIVASAITANRNITLPLMTASGGLVIDNFANIFQAVQEINLNVQDQFILYRPSSSIGSGGRNAIRFDHWDSVSARLTGVNYIVSEIVDNVLGSYDSRMSFWNRVAGAAVEVFAISSDTVAISPAWATNIVLNNGMWIQGKDSGGTARNILRMTGDDVYISNSHATGDMYFQTNSVTYMTVSQSGFLTHICPVLPAGQFETIARFTVADNTGSLFDIGNTSSTDGIFAPMIQSVVDAAVPTTSNALFIRGQIPVASDTGTTPLIQWSIRVTPAAVVVTRPLMSIQNNATEVFKWNANGSILTSVIAAASVGETLATFKVSDDASVFDIRNQLTIDAQFAPWLIGSLSTAHPATSYALRFSGFIPTAMDSGTVGAIKIDASLQSGGALAVRPILHVNNAGTELFELDAKGRVTVTHTDEGAIERLFEILVSDAAGSYFRIENNLGGVASLFSPILRAHNAAANATYSGLYIQGSIETAQDTGVASVITIDARSGTGTALASRPILVVRNAADDVFRITWNGLIECEHIAQAGGAEIMQTWEVQDDTTSYIRIDNNVVTDALFIPRIVANTRGSPNTSSNPALLLLCQIDDTMDTGTTSPVFIIDHRLDTNLPVVNRPLFDIRNDFVSKFIIAAGGAVTQTITAVASTAELFHQWKVSDSASSFLNIKNGTATDAIFAPRVESYNADSSIYAGLQLLGQINDIHDSGTMAAVQVVARLDTLAALVVRPIFGVTNNAVSIFDIFAHHFDFKNKLLTNVYGLSTFPTYKKTGVWVPCSAVALTNGSGLFGGITNVGTPAISVGVNGTLATYAISTGAQLQGWKTDAPIFRGDLGVWFSCKFSISATLNSRVAIGFSNQPTVQNAANPLANTHIGIMIGWDDAVDTNIQIFYSEGVTATKLDNGTWAKTTTPRHVGIRHNGTTWQYAISSSSIVETDWLDVTGVTTPTTTGMYCHAVCSTSSAGYNFQPRSAEIRET
jgi:hypothetical protein